jgi:urease gamma subunit
MKTNNPETLATLAHKIQEENKQSRDTVNTGHTRHRMKINHPETLSTLNTQDTG